MPDIRTKKHLCAADCPQLDPQWVCNGPEDFPYVETVQCKLTGRDLNYDEVDEDSPRRNRRCLEILN